MPRGAFLPDCTRMSRQRGDSRTCRGTANCRLRYNCLETKRATCNSSVSFSFSSYRSAPVNGQRQARLLFFVIYAGTPVDHAAAAALDPLPGAGARKSLQSVKCVSRLRRAKKSFSVTTRFSGFCRCSCCQHVHRYESARWRTEDQLPMVEKFQCKSRSVKIGSDHWKESRWFPRSSSAHDDSIGCN